MLPQCCRVPGQEGIRCICRVLPPAASACGTNAKWCSRYKDVDHARRPRAQNLKGENIGIFEMACTFFSPACRSCAVARRGNLPLGLQNY